jgi:hypothetical protein
MKNANKNFAPRVAALKSNFERLQAKNGESAGADLHAMLNDENSPFFFSEKINAQVDTWGIETGAIFSPTVNPKVTKRFIQFVGAVQRSEYKSIDRTTACILLGLHLAGDFALTSGALWELSTGGKVRAEGMGENRRGVSTRTIARLVGAVGVNTIGTQLSRSVGKNGFLQLAGATTGEPGKTNQSVTLNRTHPMVIAFIKMIEGATESQIDAMVKEKK